MAFHSNVDERGIAELVIDNPPVNALGSARLGRARRRASRSSARDAAVRVLVIRAEGRGFQAGVDVKELAADGSLIVPVNRGCYDTFAAIYDCPVPVISAVHGYCLGGGIGIAGASDLVLASEDATLRPARDRPRRDGRRHARDAHVRHAEGAAHAADGRADRRAGGVPARRRARGACRARSCATPRSSSRAKIASKSPRAVRLAK